MTPSLYRALKRYLRERTIITKRPQPCELEAFFLSDDGRRIKNAFIRRTLAKLSHNAELTAQVREIERDVSFEKSGGLI